jgi:GNAT superfamily N-acetyltransferase
MSHFIQKTTSENEDYQQLIVLLDADLKIKDGDDHAFFASHNKSDDIKHILVYYRDNQAVGCGAYKQYSDITVEIKRMFVRPEARGKGIAAQILHELEQWAAANGYSECILETGKKMTEALGLYHKKGYVITPNYGQYIGMEHSSVCMAKRLCKINDE